VLTDDRRPTTDTDRRAPTRAHRRPIGNPRAAALPKLPPVTYHHDLDTHASPTMNALQERCRPKHQVLVLKCYPRTTKGAVDVKPNSSELSYLLFYVQSRRTKIQKVGSFLEKKTASDVYRQRIGWAALGTLSSVPKLTTAPTETCRSPSRSSPP
jgi:hypothetical protein